MVRRKQNNIQYLADNIELSMIRITNIIETARIYIFTLHIGKLYFIIEMSIILCSSNHNLTPTFDFKRKKK